MKWTNYIEFWKERKFIIKGPILSYYCPENKSNKPKKRIFLGLAEIFEPKLDLEDEEDDEFEFQIKSGSDHYYMRAKNKEEKQKWLNALKNSKILGEKLIRDYNKNLNNKNNDNKFEQFKKIYNEKIKNLYKNNKQLQIVLKQFDNLINFIEGKEKFELFKIQNIKVNEEIINTDININNDNKNNKNNKNEKDVNKKIINENENNKELFKNNNNVVHNNINNDNKKINNIENNNNYKQIIKSNKIKNNNLNKSTSLKINNNNNNKSKKSKDIKNNKDIVGRMTTYIPKNNDKKIIEDKPQGRLTVSVNNFTERGYLLKGEEFFDMDESSISIKDKQDNNKNSYQKPKQEIININKIHNINNKNNNNNKNSTIDKNKNKDIIKPNKKHDILKGSFYDPLYSYQRRTSLPEQSKDVSFNIFKILKDSIGKDLNHLAMPVFLNEPLSMLQKLCENFQYADLLNKASNEPNPYLRLAYVACFNIGGLTMNIHRAKKLFNPLLFESYEYIDNKLNFRFLAEQVSHHPAISAFFAEGEGWNIYSNNHSKANPSLKGYIEVRNLAKSYVNFSKFNDEIIFNKPTIKMRNLLSDPVLDLCDKFFVKNNEGDECDVNLIPYSECKKVGNLNGEIKDIEGNIIFKIEGNWYDKIKIIDMNNKEETIIWEIIKSVDKKNYFFQPYTFDLNNLTEEMKKVLPKTDSRFRKDQRLIEYQKFDEAEVEKKRLEEKQRKKRKENEKNGIHPLPRYFEETYDDITGELVYKYRGNYFEDRKNNNFKDIPDLFG